MAKLATHCAAAATASAIARMLLGNISPSNTQTIGPQLKPKHTTTVDPADARRAVNDKVALQGNLDPTVLRANPEVIRREVRRVLDSYGNHPGHIFNLGHGVTPEVDPEHVKVLVDEVHEYGRIQRAMPTQQG